MMSLDQIHAREEIPTEHQAQILNPAMQHLPAREATTGCQCVPAERGCGDGGGSPHGARSLFRGFSHSLFPVCSMIMLVHAKSARTLPINLERITTGSLP